MKNNMYSITKITSKTAAIIIAPIQGATGCITPKNNYLKNTILEKKMAFNTNYNSISESDVIIICVPTPLNKTKDPDISYIVAVVEEIAKYSIKEKLVCLESTVYPGATE